MFGLSGEHLLILAGIILIFGPRKLPELGSSVGKALRNFKEGFNAPPSSGKAEVLNKLSETVALSSEPSKQGEASDLPTETKVTPPPA